MKHSDYEKSILNSMRQINHAISQYNRKLSACSNLTVPQLVCLQQLLEEEDWTPGKLARQVFLSQATVTGILDRLEKRSLIRRDRDRPDRRRVSIRLTEEGRRLAQEMPRPLQEQFAEQLAKLPESKQAQIDRILKEIVNMMAGTEVLDEFPQPEQSLA